MDDKLSAELQAEENLCGAVLRGGTETFRRASEVVKSTDFHVQVLGWLWEAFESLNEQGMQIDQFTVADELERTDRMKDFSSGPWSGRMYLSNIRDNGEPRNAVSYAENVLDYSNKRHLEMYTTRWHEQAVNGRRSRDIVADIMNDLSKITVFGVSDEHTAHISTGLSEAFDWSDRAGRGEIVGCPTGFIDLDKMLGTMIAGNVYLVAGRPGKGKTALLLTVALFLAKKGFKIALFSLEMSKLQVSQRLIAQFSEINLHNIVEGKMDEEEWKRFTVAIEAIEAMHIIINDLSSININQIRQTSRRIKAGGGVDLVIIDYIQLASADVKKNANREQEVSEVSRGLKYLADELQVPVLAAAQLSRAVEQRTDRRPVLSDLRESGSLEQDSYCVMFIHRNEIEKPERRNVAEIIVAKHRNGATGSIELVFRGEYSKFENAATRYFAPVREEEFNGYIADND